MILALLLPACDAWGPDAGAGYQETCVSTDDCADGLVCAGDATCLLPGEPGTGPRDGACTANAACQVGLVCAGAGVCAEPGGAGTASRGEVCVDDASCQAALACTSAGVCGGVEPTLWRGTTCEDPRLDSGAFRSFFEVPREGTPLADFYRLPFPNDIRVRDGRLDLGDHPTPGPLVPEVGDVVASVISAWQQDFTGFGPNQAVYFRFSEALDFSTLDIALSGQPGTITLVDITPGAPAWGMPQALAWKGSDSAGLYLCDHSLSVAPLAGRPLTGGHTYAVWLSTDVRSESGASLARDADFAVMLDADPPTDPALTAAWEAYAPFRAYLADARVPAGGVATAAVFTVADPHARVRALRAQARADAPTTFDALHRCDGPGGPWASVDGRGCPEGDDPAFYEFQGRLSLPRYQAGRAPYKDVDDGGSITWLSGAPERVRRDDVAFTLTIPRGPTPEDGWPVLLYAHGTGGSYRSAVVDGVAGWVSMIPEHGVGWATLTIDAPMHGPRAAPDAWDPAWLALDADAYAPDVLYYNPLNPRAARDNTLQSAADWFAIVALLDAAPPVPSPVGELRFDPNLRWFMGHSQGGTLAPLVAAHEPGLDGTLISAGGGLLIESLLGKLRPHDLPTAVRLALLDPEVDRYHPALNLIQGFAEAADGVNHASAVHYAPVDDDPSRHVVQVSGVDDLHTPEATQYALARALRTDQVTLLGAAFPNIPVATPPVDGNGNGVLAVTIRAAAAPGGDPHQVLFDASAVREQVVDVLGSAAGSRIPVLRAR